MPAAPNDNGRRDILVNDRYRFEDFRLISPLIFHEILHHDNKSGPTEELILHALDSLVFAQQIISTPHLAAAGTELTRIQNTVLMARINSGIDSHLTLRAANAPIFPNGIFVPNFSALYPEGSNGTPGNIALVAIMGNMQNPETKNSMIADFDSDTLARLYENQGLAINQIVRAAVILRLNVDNYY
ncbi:hypothetical protein [Streptomyces sp. NBC_01264]|uniref:hypothetical protein n=1 Tax=Streptomyces sp. NBC_01264 TaxID=2903804 RepID=UPI00225A9CA4|nr:hypothetical protein [Streptomyces sp. NBC_01264]MCX4784555.1 hypothetical protein [Streptomyces sp. NBC_01264]